MHFPAYLYFVTICLALFPKYYNTLPRGQERTKKTNKQQIQKIQAPSIPVLAWLGLTISLSRSATSVWTRRAGSRRLVTERACNVTRRAAKMHFTSPVPRQRACSVRRWAISFVQKIVPTWLSKHLFVVRWVKSKVKSELFDLTSLFSGGQLHGQCEVLRLLWSPFPEDK